MEFEKALNLKKRNNHLLGKKVDSSTIDELILVPTDQASADKYLKAYIQLLDGDKSINPFIGEDVEIFAVFDKRNIRHLNLFNYTNIFNLPSTLVIITD